jgi:hypothetical protein
MRQLFTSLGLLSGLALGSAAAQAQALTATSGSTLTVTSGATLFVSGGVQQASGSTLTNNGIVQLTGDLTNAGTFTSPGLLFFSGSQDQTFTPGPATVASLTVGNTGPAGANRLLLPADLTISNLLTLSQGLVRTQGSATLSLLDGARVVGEGKGQYVQGRLAVTRTDVTTGTVNFTNGLVLYLNGQALGPVKVTRTAGLGQAGVSYGQNVGGAAQGIDQVWQVAATQQPSASAQASVELRWFADTDNGFNAAQPAQLWRADQASGPWAPQGVPASVAVSGDERSFTATMTQLGVLTVSNTSQPLPVTLVSFTAQRLGADGLLKWATASELNNAYFVLESSTDGTTFQRLGQVAGAGTSSQAHSYQFIDQNLARYATGQVYYRLRQVDTDGTATYSPVRTVQVPAIEGLVVAAYPNPSTSIQEVTLSLRTDHAGPAELLLTDVLGRPVGQQQLALPAGTSTVPLPESSQLAPGVYLLRLRQGQQQQTLKLVRQ